MGNHAESSDLREDTELLQVGRIIRHYGEYIAMSQPSVDRFLTNLREKYRENPNALIELVKQLEEAVGDGPKTTDQLNYPDPDKEFSSKGLKKVFIQNWFLLER